MDKPEDLLLLDVIEVDDEESYSDLIGGEDGLEMEDNTESEYFEEDSEGRKKKPSYSFHLKKF